MSGSAPVASPIATLWEERYDAMTAAWARHLAATREEGHALVRQWEHRLAAAATRQQDLLRLGLWRGGPRTLLGALDLQHRELVLTAGLAWLLRPDGHHGLGSSLLTAVLIGLKIEADPAGPVRVELEESRGDTRADLVLYGTTWTLVVEAKTFASEQPDQLDRLYKHWGHEPGARFVFLTRGTRAAVSNVVSGEAWRSLTWAEVARLVRHATDERPDISPGAQEYLATLEAYHRV